MLRYILGPSPALYTIDKLRSHLFFKGGQINDLYYTDEEFFSFITNDEDVKPPRLTNKEVTEILNTKTKKLTKDQKLIKSVIEETQITKIITENNFKNLEEMYEFRRKYKNYIRLKRILPLSVIAPFTSNELSKMAYAAAIGSKSISLTLPGVIGYSLPAFFLFDIHYFLAEDFRSKRQLVHSFFSKSVANALSQGVHAEIDKDGVLRICRRNSPHHLRVYLKDKEIIKTVYSQLVHGLEFELEIKKSNIKRFQDLLFSNNLVDIETFENIISHHFFNFCLKRLDLTTSCTYWLVDSYRKKLRLESSEHVLGIDYFNKASLNTFSEKDSLFKLFQLLSFIRAEQLQPNKTETLLGETYFCLIFPLHKFIKFIGMDAPGGKGQARRIKVK